MNIKMLKFKNGEEIVAEVGDKSENNKLHISNPVRLIPIRTESGEGMAMVQWVMGSNDDEYDIDSSDLLFSPCTPMKEICNEYNRKYGAGIVTASSFEMPL
jgi:hypothetical protein